MVCLTAGHMVQSNLRIFQVLSDHTTGTVELYSFFGRSVAPQQAD